MANAYRRRCGQRANGPNAPSRATAIATGLNLGNQFEHFSLGPGLHGARAHGPNHTIGHRQLGHMIGTRRLVDRQNVELARSEKYLLDLDSELLRVLARGLDALRRILERADALIGPTQHADESRHDGLLLLNCPAFAGQAPFQYRSRVDREAGLSVARAPSPLAGPRSAAPARSWRSWRCRP